MRLNQCKVKELMYRYCEGNYNRFARELGVDTSHIFRFLKTGTCGGKKVIGAVMRFCIQKNLKFEEYIIL